MRKSNCLFSKLKSRILLALTVFALAFAVAGCDSPASVNHSPFSEFIGLWENSSYGSIYEISGSKITDVLMDCEFDVLDEDPVLSADGYTLILCQCSKGTSYTPTGNYYTVALKRNGNGMEISCPLDYNLTFTSVDELKNAYTSSYTIGTNGTTACVRRPAKKVTVFDESGYMTKCDFIPGNISVSMWNSGWGVYDSFMPTRDKSKEDGNVKLYLYDSSERDLVGDLHYCEVVDENGTYYVYWYHYDEDEDDNDSTLEMMFDGTFGSNCMPIVSETYLTKLKSLYK